MAKYLRKGHSDDPINANVWIANELAETNRLKRIEIKAIYIFRNQENLEYDERGLNKLLEDQA